MHLNQWRGTRVTAHAELASRVQRGAQFLDETYPGWRENVNLDTLNVALGDACVLAQVTGVDELWLGSFEIALRRAHLTVTEAVGYGFYVHGSADQADVILRYRLLTDLWRIEVRRGLRVEAKPQPAAPLKVAAIQVSSVDVARGIRALEQFANRAAREVAKLVSRT